MFFANRTSLCAQRLICLVKRTVGTTPASMPTARHQQFVHHRNVNVDNTNAALALIAATLAQLIAGNTSSFLITQTFGRVRESESHTTLFVAERAQRLYARGAVGGDGVGQDADGYKEE